MSGSTAATTIKTLLTLSLLFGSSICNGFSPAKPILQRNIRSPLYYANDVIIDVEYEVIDDVADSSSTKVKMEADTVATPPPTIATPAATAFSHTTVDNSAAARGRQSAAPAPKKSKKSDKNSKNAQGLFAPAVLFAKDIVGEPALNKLRAKVIAAHSDVIGKFTETAETTEFGNRVAKLLYAFADKDGNGKIDEEELGTALRALGFGDFFKEKQVAGVFKRADTDGSGALDFDEWLRATPKTLKTALVKLAKKNGHELGFLA